MELVFNDEGYDRLEVDPAYTHGFPQAAVISYRSRLQLLRAARNENDLKAMKSLMFRTFPMKGRRTHAIRLTDQHFLVFEMQTRHSEARLEIMEIQTANVASRRSTR